MSKERKTIEIQKVINKANHMLKHSIDKNKEGRIGIYILLESLLHDVNRYRGYRNLNKEDMTDSMHGTTYGIYKDENGNWQHNGMDDTRRMYF